MEDVEIYVLFAEINKKDVDLFVCLYLQGYQEYSVDYEYGEEDKGTYFYTESYEEMLAFMLQGDKDGYSFYLAPSNFDTDAEIMRGIFFFNKDKSLVLGLRVSLNLKQKYIDSIKNNFQTEDIICCYNEFPPTTKKEFLLKKANA